MIKVLTLTIGMKFNPIIKSYEKLRAVQKQQISELDAHLNVAGRCCMCLTLQISTVYTIRKPTSEIELDAMLKNAHLGEFTPADDEFAMFQRKSEDDSTC